MRAGSRDHHIPRFFRTPSIRRACVPRGARARAAEPAERLGAGKVFRSLQVPTASGRTSAARHAPFKTPLVFALGAGADKTPASPTSLHPLHSRCPALSSPEPSPRRTHPSTHAPQSSLHYTDLPFFLASGPRPEAGPEHLLGPKLRAPPTSGVPCTRTNRSRDQRGWVPRACGSAVCTLQPPASLPKTEKTSPAPTFRREEAAPPAVPAVAAAAAAAPHAQRQQERHQAQPPRQHPPAARAATEPPPTAYRLPPAPASLAGLRRCPPRWRCRGRFGRRRPHPRPPAALRRAARTPACSLARSLAGNSSTHWRGPGAAPALTPGRPVTSRKEGGGSLHIHETRTLARGCALPSLAALAPNFAQPSPLPPIGQSRALA